MLKRIKRGVKKIMEKSMELGKAVFKGLTNTRNRSNVAILLVGIGLSLGLSSYLENGGHLYPREEIDKSEE